MNSCGNDKANVVSVTSYQPRAGDFFKYERNAEYKYSNGEEVSFGVLREESYCQVESIPNHYGYNSSLHIPYILCTKTEDGEPFGYEYFASDGTEIISDNLTTFTRVDAQTTIGSDDPVNASPGDAYTFYEKSTLFDSQTLEGVGIDTVKGEFKVFEAETITVSAGTFACLRIDFNLEMEHLYKDNRDTINTTGSVWFDIENGIAPKLTSVGNMTRSNHELSASITTSVFLIDYMIESDSKSNENDIQDDGFLIQGIKDVMNLCLVNSE